MALATDKLDSLRSAVAAPLATDAAATAPFAVDGLAPAAVVEPADTKELIAVIEWARAAKAALFPATSGCYLPLGNPAAALDVAVSLRRMNRVLDYDPGDLTLSVEAGARLADVEKLLAEHRQFLPADPPYADRAALGGLLATNATGPLRFGFGAWRDFVLGMKFVTGDAKLVKTGGRVVKNVAGYDLAKLLIGSLGSLGVITEVNFKVFPAPPLTTTFVFGFDTLAAALTVRDRLVHSAWQPQALELLDPAMGALLSTQPLSPHHWSVVVAVGGVDAVLRRYQTDFAALARELRAAQFDALRGHDEEFVLTALRERIPRARQKFSDATIAKCPLPLTSVGPFLEKTAQVAARYELPSAAAAHAGSGIVHRFLLPDLSTAEPGGTCHRDASKRMAQAATEMIHAGNNLGGRVTVPFCPTAVKRDVNVWGPLRDDFPLMQKLKAQFDPGRIFNPGRFVGGL
jgi:glycolate oxidase FAD binding subunit